MNSFKHVEVILKLLLAAAVLMLSGCVGGGTNDLENWTNEVLRKPGGRIEPLPEIKPYEAYAYQGSEQGAKDPFRPFYRQREPEKPDDVDTGLTKEMEREIRNRNREELEQFELDSLRMVGTLQNEDNNWAIVSDPDGVIHRVRVGNYMGRNIGKIINIFEDRVELREIVKNSTGRWEERQAALALIEE